MGCCLSVTHALDAHTQSALTKEKLSFARCVYDEWPMWLDVNSLHLFYECAALRHCALCVCVLRHAYMHRTMSLCEVEMTTVAINNKWRLFHSIECIVRQTWLRRVNGRNNMHVKHTGSNWLTGNHERTALNQNCATRKRLIWLMDRRLLCLISDNNRKSTSWVVKCYGLVHVTVCIKMAHFSTKSATKVL